MKIIIFGLGFVVLLLTVDLVYAERDILQKWKDYIESYEDYMEKYKKWAENKFQVYKDNINELERKIFELNQEIEQLEEEKNITQPQLEAKHQNVKSQYIITDKKTYGLGDTVYVTGKLMEPLTKTLLNGTMVYPDTENINILIKTPENTRIHIDGLGGCMRLYPYDENQFNLHANDKVWRQYENSQEFGKYYHHTLDTRTECDMYNGKILGSFEITNDFTTGTHKLKYTHQSMSTGTDRIVYSQPFIVR